MGSQWSLRWAAAAELGFSAYSFGEKSQGFGEKCPWGKGRKDKFTHFSNQNNKEGFPFPP